MTQFPDHPFWDYSVDVYMKKGVGEACIVLQEKYQLDVNVLLFCLWLGASGRGLIRDGEMKTMLAAVSPWHREVVRKLRAVRTLMKGGVPPVQDSLCESLRQRIQKIEIDCEHAEQLVLANAVLREPETDRPVNERARDAAVNLGRYFKTFEAVLSDDDRARVSALLSAGLPGFSGDPEDLCDIVGTQ